jgi:uroporphyrinogen-III decarboxylase
MSPAISNRERMLATLAGEHLDYVPSWTQAFYNLTTVHRLMPASLWADDFDRFLKDGQSAFTPFDERTLDRLSAFNRHIDRVAAGVGRGGNAFGHGGPGEFIGVVIEEYADHQIIEFETGAKAKLNFRPHFYHHFDMPVRGLADLEAMELPDPEDPRRWNGVRQDVAYLKENGEYTVGYLNGFFSGCHYFFCDYQDLMLALALDRELVERLVARLGDWNLSAAQMMCQAGVDCISLADDLGSGKSLLFSPELYDLWFFPWHRALCDLAHSYGVHVHLHSHGNIMPILDRVVETGIDMLHPLDPTEGIDLAAIKERHGDRLTLVGGLDNSLFDRELPEIERRVRQTVETGGQGGRFILSEPGGIPETVSREEFNAYLTISRRVRGQAD